MDGGHAIPGRRVKQEGAEQFSFKAAVDHHALSDLLSCRISGRLTMAFQELDQTAL